MAGHELPPDLAACLERGGTVLTATRRLARHLAGRFAMNRRQLGDAGWLAPTILSADAWFEKQMVLLGQDWLVLPRPAVRHLWEEILAADASAHRLSLLQIPAMAGRALEAHELLAEAGGEPHGWDLSEDHRAFLRWRGRYQQALMEGNWIDPSAVPWRVVEALEHGTLVPPAELLLVGFDELRAPLRRLLAVLKGVNCQAGELPPPVSPIGQVRRVAARHLEDEVRQAARWVRRLLEAGCANIGVVVPDLNVYRAAIERVFLEEIDPPALLALAEEEVRFSLSLGRPLARQGLVQTALQILAAGPELALDDLSRLLRSPYLGGALQEERDRAGFDRHLRSLRRDRFSLATLEGLAARWAGSGSPGRGRLNRLRQLLGAWQTASREADRLLPGRWTERFADLLHRLGWPGERTLESVEYQALQAWQDKLLPRLAALDQVSRPLSRGEAVSLLRRLAEELEFQPEGADPGVQICGVLEAGGLAFDHLWVLGLQENAWPPPARPNPFLPVSFQVRHGLPHADASRESRFAKLVTDRLQAAAPFVIFSYPLQEDDCQLRPSPMIRQLEPGTPRMAASQAPALVLGAAAPVLETLVDDRGPSLAGGSEVTGGVSLLRDQALCPFRAFARHRLGARAFDRPAPGLDPATRGDLVHAVLEEFWQNIRSQARLQALPPEPLSAAVRNSVEVALDSYFENRPPRPGAAMLAMETTRLTRLVEEWLREVEWSRPGFVDCQSEIRHQAQVGELTVHTRIDRIDRLADGRQLVIDYKTGVVRLDDLLHERLLEPQLPLYATGLDGAQLAGVAIGQVRRGDCRLRGLAREGDVLPGTGAFTESKFAQRLGLEGWPELLARWRRQLSELGEEFVAGHAPVAPVDIQKACRFCDLAPLCRIGEGDLEPPDREGEGS